MLPESARNVMSVPHPSGRAAMRMLEHEGFTADGYVDIFDGGPTMSVHTDQIRAIRESREMVLDRTSEEPGGVRMMLAAGGLTGFSACYGRVRAEPDGIVTLDPESAQSLGLEPGGRFLAIGR